MPREFRGAERRRSDTTRQDLRLATAPSKRPPPSLLLLRRLRGVWGAAPPPPVRNPRRERRTRSAPNHPDATRVPTAGGVEADLGPWGDPGGVGTDLPAQTSWGGTRHSLCTARTPRHKRCCTVLHVSQRFPRPPQKTPEIPSSRAHDGAEGWALQRRVMTPPARAV